MSDNLLENLNNKLLIFNNLKKTIKKKLPIHSKLYIFLLFIKSFKLEFLKILLKLIRISLFNKKEKIILKINKNKISFVANSFYTTSYFLYDEIPEKPILDFLYNYFHNKKKSTFLDVGGYVGLHSFVVKVANQNSKIHIFEADKNKCHILRKNIKINKFNNINLNEQFITSSKHFKNPNDFTKYTKNEISINQYLNKKNISNVDVIKMDIEGIEFSALDKVNFNKIKILLVEFHSKIIRENLKQNPNILINKLKKNYNLFYFDHRKNNNKKILKLTKRKILEKDQFMLVCSKKKLDYLEKYLKTKVIINKIK